MSKDMSVAPSHAKTTGVEGEVAGCDCIHTVNAQLKEHNAWLVATMFGVQKAVINTVKRDEKKRGKPPVMVACFCPFCGVKYPEAAQ